MKIQNPWKPLFFAEKERERERGVVSAIHRQSLDQSSCIQQSFLLTKMSKAYKYSLLPSYEETVIDVEAEASVPTVETEASVPTVESSANNTSAVIGCKQPHELAWPEFRAYL